ncbi:hypothetical protein C8R44DRAFT_766438 [Mycena epipterygia]|nr:hypothetical protein C8R44DRAFT_766438 [Mycena epipterygia]
MNLWSPRRKHRHLAAWSSGNICGIPGMGNTAMVHSGVQRIYIPRDQFPADTRADSLRLCTACCERSQGGHMRIGAEESCLDGRAQPAHDPIFVRSELAVADTMDVPEHAITGRVHGQLSVFLQGSLSQVAHRTRRADTDQLPALHGAAGPAHVRPDCITHSSVIYPGGGRHHRSRVEAYFIGMKVLYEHVISIQ